jgi:hypothetical protein
VAPLVFKNVGFVSSRIREYRKAFSPLGFRPSQCCPVNTRIRGDRGHSFTKNLRGQAAFGRNWRASGRRRLPQ